MRLYLTVLLFLIAAFYAFKNWRLSLCFLVFSMCILERPDFPKTMFGIPGFDPWNLLFLFLVGLFIVQSKNMKDGATMPPGIRFLLWYYFVFILIGAIREASDLTGIYEYYIYKGYSLDYSATTVYVDHGFNTLKYAIPGVLFYYLANSRNNILWGVGAVLGMNFVLALLVLKVMPLSELTNGDVLEELARRRIDRDIGYYRSALAILFASGAWGFYALRGYLDHKTLKILCLIAFVLMSLAMGLTGGRIGIGSWIVAGSLISYFIWRRLLILGPLFCLIVLSFSPAIQDRLFQGIDTESTVKSEEVNMESVTSERSKIWPAVIDASLDAPFFGYGRNAMQRIGLSIEVEENLGVTNFPHPHNAYLSLFLENGIILGAPILILFFILLRYSISLLKDKRNSLYVLTGSLGFIYIVCAMVGYMGLLSFYPYTSSTSMWCLLGIMLRVHTERKKLPQGKEDHVLFSPQIQAEAPQPGVMEYPGYANTKFKL